MFFFHYHLLHHHLHLPPYHSHFLLTQFYLKQNMATKSDNNDFIWYMQFDNGYHGQTTTKRHACFLFCFTVLGRHVAFSCTCLHRIRRQKGDNVTFCMLLLGLGSQFWYSKAAITWAVTEELYFFLNDASNVSCYSCITHIKPEHDQLFGEKIMKSPVYSKFSPGHKDIISTMTNIIC